MTFPKHFDGERFYNPDAPQVRGLADVLRWKLTSRAEKSPRFVSDVEQSKPPARFDGGVRVTLVNHSSALIQENGLNILTDPIWSERASPFSWVGPKRHRAPGVRQDDLPRIDIVLLSHNHYDHLDLPTLRWIAKRDGAAFVVPAGIARLLRSEKIGPVTELDWGGSEVFEGRTITAVPAIHFAARGPFDRNRTLWCGYAIGSEAGPIYFAGDTAFGKHFAAIRQMSGAPRVALLPIGAYQPRWFMSAAHMGPEEAIEAHRILESKNSIAIHHGTFQLADEGIDAAENRFRSLAPPDSFIILRNGSSACFA